VFSTSLKLFPTHKACLFISLAVLLLIVPRVLLIGFVGLERLLIAAIIAVEQSIVAAVEAVLVSAAGLGIVALILRTTFSFLFPRQRGNN
jgi:hypothetical protein